MSRIIPVDLMKTGGKLVPPDATALPQRPAKPQPAAAPEATKAPAPPAEAAEPAKEPEVPVPRCKHCGWVESIDPVEPDPSDVTDFVRSVLRNELFTKELRLFDDNAAVTFRVLTADEEDAIRNVVRGEIGTAQLRTNLDVSERFTDLRLGLGVSRIRLGTHTETRTAPADPFKADLTKLYTDLRTLIKSQPVYQAVRWQFERFLGIVGTITHRALNPSFSPATGSSGSSSASPPKATAG